MACLCWVLHWCYESFLKGKAMFESLISALMAQFEQPKQDLEKNLRALLSERMSQMNLVTLEQFERQQLALAQANQRLAALEAQLQHLQDSALH